jgi:hypothetical protein
MSRPVNINETLELYPTGINTSQSSYSSGSNNANAQTRTDSTTYSTLTCSNGSGVASYVTYTFNITDDTIPSGAIIDSISCKIKARVSNTTRIATAVAQLYADTTAKGGTASFRSTSSSPSPVTISNVGSWTLAELKTARIRFTATRGTSQTSSSASMYIYGTDLDITYSISGTAYTVAATSTITGYTATPATQELIGGSSAEIRIDGNSLDDIKVTDNDNDVTNSLVQHTNTSGSFSDTFIPSSFDSTNSVYNTTAGDSGNGIYSTNYIENGLTNASSTTRCALYSVQGSGAISKMYYNFDCSSIPANAVITSVSCQFKGGSQGSSYYSSYTAQLTTGTTLKGTAQSVTGSNSSPTTVTISGGTNWSRAELNNIKILFQVTRGSSNTTTDSTWSFFGATLTVAYTVPASNPYYWIYTLSNLTADHTILIDQAGAFVPPEEDPEYNYYPITISSINATTHPGNGTTRIQEGTNQVITITPTDPQLTLALDNGVDITSQLVGGTPTNNYTVTTQVSGASYGFNLNSSTGYYVSTNNGVSKSASVARLNMDFESDCLVTIQYINYAEASYDYGMFGKLDTTVATDGLTASSGSSSPSDSTSNYEIPMCTNSSSAQTVSYQVPSGTHYIDIKYGKDDATNSNNDSLQWKVLSVEATSAGGDYTYTLTNVSQKHSLVFIFGNVSYYFITSSTTDACKLFPDGQFVKLSGDSYSLTIVPDDPTATVTLTDNNVDRTSQLEYYEGEDKYGNTVVNYIYRLSNINATHTLVASCSSAISKLYLKVSGSWVEYEKVYLKVNGSWVEQNPSAWNTIFNTSTVYEKKN